ncbi:MAG: hypothetical protein K6T34_01885 [Thermoflavifilum sp.]|nr:hypothetical protein [Thermoflavifilum sp.]
MDAYFLAQLFSSPIFVAQQNVVELQGKFEKKVLVVITAGEQTATLQQLLNDILRSCKLIPEQDAGIWYVDDAIQSISWSSIHLLMPQVVLLFGIPIADLPTAGLNAYQPFTAHHTQFLLADSLSILHADKSKKKLLWQALKRMFVIN